MRRPNILFSMCDDQRHDCMGCAGHPFLQTPAMDRLAREGARFANGFTAIPLSAPSRASNLTGVYAHVHGVAHNRAAIDPSFVTWPEELQKAGYRTGFFGKSHFPMPGEVGLGGSPKPGFERWVSFRNQGAYENPVFIVDGKNVALRGYNTDLLADYVDEFLSVPDDRPWAICLWYKAPHGPFTPARRHADDYADGEWPRPAAFGAARAGKTLTLRERGSGHCNLERFDGLVRNYLRTLRAVDDALGRVLDRIDRRGEAEHTLVIHTSDHGFFHGEFGLGDKRWMYDPSIRIPYLVRYPALIARPGRVIQDDVLSLDLPATILDLAGLRVPDHYQGQSLRPVLTGSGRLDRQALFIEYFEDPQFAWFPTMLCLRTPGEKLIHYLRPGESDEFYDLVADPAEFTNVIDRPEYAERVAFLRRRLEEARRAFGFRVPAGVRGAAAQ